MPRHAVLPALLAVALLGARSSSAQTVDDCLDDTGYAFEDRGSQVRLTRTGNAQAEFLFPTGTGTTAFLVTCAPPLRSNDGRLPPAARELTGAQGAARASARVGVGINANASGLTTPGRFSASATVIGRLFYRFDILAEDPAAAGNVDLRVLTRYDFGNFDGAASNGGSFSTEVDVEQLLQWSGASFGQAQWSTSTPAAGGSTVVDERTVSVPANGGETFRFRLVLDLTAIARGAPPSAGGAAGDAKAQGAVTVTHAFEVPDGYRLRFRFEDRLALAPPQLGSVGGRAGPDDGARAITVLMPLLLDEN